MKKSVGPLWPQFWCHRGSTYLVLFLMSQTFQGTPEVNFLLTFWPPAPPKRRGSYFLSPKKGDFRGIFWRKSSFPAKPSIFDPIVLHIFRKLSIWGFRKSGWNSIFDILWSVRFLVTGWDRYVPISRDLVLRPIYSQPKLTLVLKKKIHPKVP